jgi:hypothetical protein
MEILPLLLLLLLRMPAGAGFCGLHLLLLHVTQEC